MSVAEIADVVRGTLIGVDDPTVPVRGKAEFDSRRIGQGDLFAAFVGERTDGHDFVAAARAGGAVAVLSSRPVDGGSIVVEDVLSAMSALAAANARQLTATVVGVTGSSGKTSTKDLISQLLEHVGCTIAPPESFNNELGYPYTVLLADARTEYLVLETSARGVGHIRQLTAIARPRIGVVLNVGTAHLGEFGSVAAIAQAKGELVDALPDRSDGGVAVLNADDAAVDAMASRTRATIVRFSALGNPQADVVALDVRVDPGGRPGFTLRHMDEQARVQLRLVGRHHIGNALAAAAVGIMCGMPVDDVAAALSAATPRSHWRMEVTRTDDDVTVVNDAYNANPDSVRAALRATADLRDSDGGGRVLAVLGPMAELGSASPDEHRAVGRFAAELRLDLLIGVGDPAREMVSEAGRAGAGMAAEWLPDVSAAAQRLDEILKPGDVVLVKGSRAAGMERVAEAVLNRRGRGRA